MLHQDLRPDNIMIDMAGTAKIIDFGSTRIAGLAETAAGGDELLGTPQYTAPEYFLGEGGTERSDLFSLGVITYQMLTGRLPYGAGVAQARTRARQRRLNYVSPLDLGRDVPLWVDRAIAKAVQIAPADRHAALSEFVQDLPVPNPSLVDGPGPLLDRNPMRFRKFTALGFAIAVVALAFKLVTR